MRDKPCARHGRAPKPKLRVITEDVGGAFGLKTGAYPEYIAPCWSARRRSAGRCTGCRAARSRSSATTTRATPITEVELALDDKGKFLALRIRHLGNMGAYIGAVGANIQTANFTRCLPGMYDIKLIDIGVRKCVFTNTTPTAPYRGAGRPEANYVLERVVDEAARVTGIDPVKLRRRNLIPPQGDAVQDRGRHHLSTAAISQSCSTRRSRSPTSTASSSAGAKPPKRGKLRGLGISCVLEHSGGFADRRRRRCVSRAATSCCSPRTCSRPARATPRCSRAWSAERLGIEAEQVEHRHGDSAIEIAGLSPRSARARR